MVEFVGGGKILFGSCKNGMMFKLNGFYSCNLIFKDVVLELELIKNLWIIWISVLNFDFM